MFKNYNSCIHSILFQIIVLTESKFTCYIVLSLDTAFNRLFNTKYFITFYNQNFETHVRATKYSTIVFNF